MCGRFTLKGPPNQIARMLGLATVPNLAPRYNIAPTQDVLALRHEAGDGDRHLAWLRWGLIPFWAKDMAIGAKMINARADTVAGTTAALRQWLTLPADQQGQMGLDGEQLFREQFDFASVARNLLPALEAANRQQPARIAP